jgi:hypothetical protein
MPRLYFREWAERPELSWEETASAETPPGWESTVRKNIDILRDAIAHQVMK